MPLPKEVTKVQVKHSFEFDERGLPMQITHFSYFIGRHGPFTRKFFAGEFQTAHVERVLAEHVAQFRELGLLEEPKRTE